MKHSTWEPEENILDDRLILGFEQKERDREIHGPKKRGPKPKSLLVKPRAKKGETNNRGSSSRQIPLRSSSSASTQAAPAPSSSASPQPLPSSSSSAVALTPKLNSLAATHKLKKDIHRCHRMSRRPLPRSDPMSSSYSNTGGFPSRMHSSPFSETVRIVNRRVKPREVKRSRIILNLKVIDKPGRGSTSASNRNVPPGRQNIPSRNRIIGKKGEAPYRPFQPPLKMLGFPMYGKPFGLQCGGPMPFQPPPVSCSSRGARDSRTTSSQFQSLPPPSSSGGAEGKSLTSAAAALSQPGTSPSNKDPKCSKPHAESGRSFDSSPSSDINPAAVESPLNSPSPSSSSGDKEEVATQDRSTPSEEGRKNPRQHSTAKLQLPTSLPLVAPGDQTSAPVEPRRVPGEGDPNWHPEMGPSCKDVVVTDVTTNLVTVTIKEFPSPASGPASPSASPDNSMSQPPTTTSGNPSLVKP